MNVKYKNLSKNALVFSIGSIGSRLILFLLVPLYTYVLDTSEYGTIDLLNTTVQLLLPILTINIQDAVLRFCLDQDYKKEDVLKASSKIISIGSIVLLVSISLLRFCNVIKINNAYLIYLWFSFFFGALHNSVTMYLKSTEMMHEIALGGIINTVVCCGFNILFLLVFKLGIVGYMLSYILGLFFSIIYMIGKGKVISAIRIGEKNEFLLKIMLAYSLPLIANGIAWWINNASDRYVLTFFCGAALNGVYAVSYKIPSILATVQNIFYNAWSVSAITEFDKNDSDGFIGSIFKFYTIASIWACSIIMLFNIPIAKILYSKDFFIAWKYVPILLVSTVFNGLGLFVGCLFTAVKKTNTISNTTIMGAIINTALNFALVPYLGATGAAIATFFGYFVIFLVRMSKLKAIVSMKIDWSHIIVCLLLLCVQAIIASIGKYFIVQFSIFALTVGVNYKYAKMIIKRVTRSF